MRILPFLVLSILIFQIPSFGPGKTSASTSWPMEYLKGNLTVGPGETMIIENRSIFIDGSLMVEGTLILRNSDITVNRSNDNIANVAGSLRLFDLDKNASTMDGSMLVSSGGYLPVFCNGKIDCLYSILDGVSVFGGDVTIGSSSVLNDSLFVSGIYNISDSDLDASIDEPDPTSTIKDSRILGHIEMMGSPGGRYVFSGLTVSGSTGQAFAIGSGNLSLWSCSISDVKYGISYGPSTALDLRQVSIRSDMENLHSSERAAPGSDITMIGCTLERGINDLGFGTANINLCSFNDSTILNIGKGQIANSILSNSTVAIGDLGYINATRNRLIGCTIGFSNVTGGSIHHNAFLDIDIPYLSVEEKVSCYDNGEGNYYSGYRGKDDGSGDRQPEDGIGDTQLPYMGHDMYPLMYDNYWLMPSLPVLDTDYVLGEPNLTIRIVSGERGLFIIQDSTSWNFKDDLRSFSTRAVTVVVPDCANRTHYLRARLYNEYGSRGWCRYESVVVDQRPLPPDIVDVSAPPSGGRIKMEWRYVGEDVFQVGIFYREQGSGTARNEWAFYPSTEADIKGLKNNLPYEVRLYSIDGQGLISRYATAFIATPRDLEPTGPPRDVSGEALDNSSIAIRWTPPEVQDISSYEVMRSDSSDGPFVPLSRVSKDRFTYVDEGLKDNTTYYYGVRTVDDDGPFSEMGGPIAVRTDHINNPPIFVGTNQHFDRTEGDPPIRIEIITQFSDPDGDPFTIEITEANPFNARLDGDDLVITPEKDQSGDGHVQLMVSDGEDSVYFYLTVYVRPVPDPPRIIEILKPLNNSVLIPGTAVTLAADVEDPDLPDDILTLIWTSDRDGIVSFNSAGRYDSIVFLSPGIHRLTLAVTDSTEAYDEKSVIVAVSIWGFRQMMWNFTVDLTVSYVETGGLHFVTTIVNDATATLTFRCALNMTGPNVSEAFERVLVLSGGTSGTVIFKDRIDLDEGSAYRLSYSIRAETMNGTFAGDRNETHTFLAERRGKDTGGDGWMLQAISVAALFLIVVLGTYIMIMIRKNNRRKREIGRESR